MTNSTYEETWQWIAVTCLQAINLWSIVGNALIIGLIRKTPQLKGFTGDLMINQAVADLLNNAIIFVLTLLGFSGYLIQLQTVLRLSNHASIGVAVFSLSVMSINICLAICKPMLLRKITWKQRRIVIGASWVVNICIMSLYYIQDDLYDTSDTTGIVVMKITQSNIWFPLIVITNVAVIPLSINVASYSCITYKTKMKMTLTLGARNQDKMRLSKLIHVIAIIFIVTYIPLATVVAFNIEIQGLKSVFALLNNLYHASKVFLYMYLYTPLRTTAKAFCCLTRANRVEDIRLPGMESHIKQREDTHTNGPIASIHTDLSNIS